MSKELPYFKFIATEWLSGDIVLESLELQGMFINICALYWKAGGRLPKAKLDARFRPHEYQPLVDRGLMKIKKNISISFLDDQFKSLSKTRQRQIEGGRKGGLRSAKGKLKGTSSILDKDKDKDKDIIIGASASSRATPQNIKEVKAYILEKKLLAGGAATEQAAHFWDHFSSNGWKVSGKAVMKDWKAAVRNWVRNHNKFKTGDQSSHAPVAM